MIAFMRNSVCRSSSRSFCRTGKLRAHALGGPHERCSVENASTDNIQTGAGARLQFVDGFSHYGIRRPARSCAHDLQWYHAPEEEMERIFESALLLLLGEPRSHR